jgi:hypothetical protein
MRLGLAASRCARVARVARVSRVVARFARFSHVLLHVWHALHVYIVDLTLQLWPVFSLCLCCTQPWFPFGIDCW